MKSVEYSSLEQAAEIWRASKVAVALTGAGISVASGIPDFRSPKGLWSEFAPMEYATLDAFIQEPNKVWQMFLAVNKLARECQANTAHTSLAELEKADKLKAVITQNIDGLHQLAGSKNVIEMHGCGRILACPECNYTEALPEAGLQIEPVPCPRARTIPGSHRTHRYLKPNVILFGEDLKREVIQDIIHWQNSMDLLIIIGTSADVYPAAALPNAVKALGAKIIEINVEPTRVSRTLSPCFLQGKAEEILPPLQKLVLA
ncbi:MAG: NAD-dependent deacylase [Acidobacteria bacterium]|nr:NAD-dependent deacylase [Acidobacteriota bacterium]